MKPAILALAIVVSGCATTAQTQYYRPANYSGAPMQIAGRFDPMQGFAGRGIVTINGETVVEKDMPLMTNTTEASGSYKDKPVTVVFTRIQTFMSSYVRADVMIGNERAASLTF